MGQPHNNIIYENVSKNVHYIYIGTLLYEGYLLTVLRRIHEIFKFIIFHFDNIESFSALQTDAIGIVVGEVRERICMYKHNYIMHTNIMFH